MTIEQILIEKWRALSSPRQQEVIDFVEFLESKQAVVKIDNQPQLRSFCWRSLAKNPSRDSRFWLTFIDLGRCGTGESGRQLR
jgi:hypothetical protein